MCECVCVCESVHECVSVCVCWRGHKQGRTWKDWEMSVIRVYDVKISANQ